MPKALTLTILLFFLGSISHAQQASIPATSNDKSTGTISGRVVTSSGEPLPGASVSVSSIGAQRFKNATSDSSGEFKIDGLEAGLYRVSAFVPAYAPAPVPGPSETATYHHIGDSVTITLSKGAVITGTVTNANGPLTGVGVHAIRIRDEDGKILPFGIGYRERQTDDRGVYRFYGLPAGSYLIAAGKPQVGYVAPTPYDNDAPTYFPSGTRDTASEIVVRSGDEITADIQYRAEPGHAISGKVAGIAESESPFSANASVTLVDVRDRTASFSTGVSSGAGFAYIFSGIPDGDYEVYASQYLRSRDELKSPARRVTVRGADTTGVNLSLAAMASISGRVIFENDPKSGCARRRETAAQETIVFGRRYEPDKKPATQVKDPTLADVSILSANAVGSSVADAKGVFVLKNLAPGSYFIDPRAPASGWYLRSISISGPQTTAVRAPNLAILRDGIALRTSERVSGLTVTFTEGAASLRGRVTITEAQNVPLRTRVYLVPAEKENADNVLRFFEAAVEADGRFALGNIAPGRYFVIARQSEEIESRAKLIRQDADFRTRVTREAEGLKKEISFKPCERVSDYQPSFSVMKP